MLQEGKTSRQSPRGAGEGSRREWWRWGLGGHSSLRR